MKLNLPTLETLQKFAKEEFNKIQFRIVSVFLILMSVAAITIITINYKENQKAISETSLITTRQIGLGAIQHLNSIIDSVQMLTITTASLISEQTEVSKTHFMVINHLLSTLVENTLIARIEIATIDGLLLSAAKLNLTNQTQYRFNLIENLPDRAHYVISTITNTNGVNLEECIYLDTSFNVVTTESHSPPLNDRRTKSWYSEIIDWPRNSWSNPYDIASGIQGISFSTPIISEKKLIGVVGTDLALSSLSDLILDTVIGTTGRAFVLNNAGEIILPVVLSGSMPYIIEEGYDVFTSTGKTNFVLKSSGESYVFEIFNFPLDVNTEWVVIMSAPLSDFFDPILKSDINSIFAGFITLLIAALLIYLASGKIAKPINQLAEEVKQIQDLDFTEGPPIVSNIYEISLLNASIQTMRKVFASFTKYVPKDVVTQLILQDEFIKTLGERKNMTILFSDIAEFTTIAESMKVEDISKNLTEYFEIFTNIILSYAGTIDKYIGDSVMALWNAPLPVASHSEKACEACLIFIAKTKNPNEKNPFLRASTYFGINSGEVIVGNIGTSERISYTAIGTVVNTTDRLLKLNKIYNTSVIIGENTRENIPSRFITRPLDFIAVKGRKQPIQIHELMGLSENANIELNISTKEIELAKQFTQAFNAFHKGDLKEAKTLFTAISKQYPKDDPTKIYLKRIEELK